MALGLFVVFAASDDDDDDVARHESDSDIE
jgi:hypothetical protein